MLKKVWATVTDKEFYDFKDRAAGEGLTIGDAFVALVRLYGRGGMIVMPKKNNHHEPTGAKYVSES